MQSLSSDHQRTMSLKGPRVLTYKRMNRTRIIEFEYRDGSDGQTPAADAVRRERRGFPALSLCFCTFFPWSPCLMFVYLYPVPGPVLAALTSKPSVIQINVRRTLHSSRPQSVPVG